MKTVKIILTADQIKYLSIAFNNQELSMIFPRYSSNFRLENFVKIHYAEIAHKLLMTYNTLTYKQRIKCTITLHEAQALALCTANAFEGFRYFGDYERTLIDCITNNIYQPAN